MLKNLISIKKGIKRIFRYKYNKSAIITLKNTIGKKRLILLLTPTYGNIGDHAIAFCEHLFLKDYFESYTIIEISDICWEYEKNNILNYVKKDDCLLIHGGGFIGTLWENAEWNFREIIQKFPNNRIIVFPQSIFFDNDENSQRQLNISKTIYAQHSQLFICARERNSYEYVKNNKLIRNINNCFLIPDIVTYYKEYFSVFSRNNKVLLCFRGDKEKVVNENMIGKIIDVLSDVGLEFSFTDTVVPYRIYGNKRNNEIFKKLSEFAQCKFIITDRLHGMILASITETPCLFLDNYSKKVSGTYEWIKNLEYIKPLKDIDCLRDFIKKLEDEEIYHYSNEHLQPYYAKLAKIIKGI